MDIILWINFICHFISQIIKVKIISLVKKVVTIPKYSWTREDHLRLESMEIKDHLRLSFKVALKIKEKTSVLRMKENKDEKRKT